MFVVAHQRRRYATDDSEVTTRFEYRSSGRGIRGGDKENSRRHLNYRLARDCTEVPLRYSNGRGNGLLGDIGSEREPRSRVSRLGSHRRNALGNTGCVFLDTLLMYRTRELRIGL